MSQIPGDVYEFFQCMDENEMRWVKEWLVETPARQVVEEILDAIQQGEDERERD